MRIKNKQQSGFTIVELLIVIVVIGILAAITITAYNGIQTRGRDTHRKSDLAQIAKSLYLYAADNNDFISAIGTCTAGYNGTGGGWYHSDYDGAGPWKSISGCLMDGGYISKALTDPQASKGCTAIPATTPVENECFYYMKYNCGTSVYLYANLENQPHSSTDTDATCMTTLDSSYGMNYYVKIN